MRLTIKEIDEIAIKLVAHDYRRYGWTSDQVLTWFYHDPCFGEKRRNNYRNLVKITAKSLGFETARLMKDD